jgi:bacterioferritin
MGKTAKEIVGNAGEIVEELNKALADEWLAYMQYTFAAKVVKAPIVIAALEDTAKEELEHANELTDRIIKLGGMPIVDPKQFYEKTNCGYEVPEENAKKVLEAAIKGEGCAIKVYDKIAKMAKDSDPLTYELMLHIMEEEENHEQKFEDLREWLKEM